MVGSPEFVLGLTEEAQMTLYIAVGEHRGGIWNYDRMEWEVSIPPRATYAILAEAKS